MRTIESRPRTQSGVAAQHDVALIVALVGPPAMLGLLIVLGVNAGVAAFIMFVTVFAITTALDVQWLVRTRRAPRRSRSTACT